MARARLPGHGVAEGVIDLENPDTIAETLQRAPITVWQAMSGDTKKLAWRDIKDNARIRRQFVDILHFATGDDLPTVVTETGSQRIADSSGSSARDGPAHRMTRGTESNSDRR